MLEPTPHPPGLVELDLFASWTSSSLPESEFDPFEFAHRIAAYRTLLVAINGDGFFEPDNRRNPLWGLMFQHQWQFSTGRLGADSLASGRIDPDAPWGYGNYLLCVVPWLGAEAADLVEPRIILGPTSPTRFSYDLADPGVRRAVQDWESFFRLAAGARPGDPREPIRMAMWAAHKTSLDLVAAELRGIDPAPYSAKELAFLLGWCRMVDYLWAAAWPTDFGFMVTHGLDVLPDRLLVDHDRLEDQTPAVRANVRQIIALGRRSPSRYARDLRLWRRIMRSRQARREVVDLLEAIFRPSRGNLGLQARAAWYLLRP